MATFAYSSERARRQGGAQIARIEWAAVAAITIAGIALRIFHLGFHSLNGGDEPFSLALAQRSFGHMFNLFGFEANGTLYSIVLWPVIRIANQSEAAIRSPAMVAGALAVPALWWAGRQLVNSWTGIAAATLMAVNPMATFHSQYARPFAFVMLFSTLSFATLAMATAEDGGRRKWWVLYGASMAAAAYSNSLTPVFLVPAQAVVVVPRGRAALRAWIWSLVALAIVCVPLLVALIIERSRRNPLYWLTHPGPGDIVDAATEFTTGLSNLIWIYKLTALVTLGMGAFVAVRAWRSRENLSPLAVPLAWTVLPVAGLFVFSQISPAFHEPYLIGALPGALLLIAALAMRLPRPAGLAALGLIAAVGLFASIHQATRQVDENWRGAVSWVAQEKRPNDRILIDVPNNIPVFGYYNARWRAPDGNMPVLEWKDEPISKDFIPVDDPGGYTGPTGPPSKQLVARNATGGKRLFVVLSEYVQRLQGDVPNEAGLAWAKANCQVTRHPEKNIILMVVSGCPSVPSRG